MENQPNQPIQQTTEESAPQAVGQGSSVKIWYIVLAVAVIGLGLAYFAMKSPVTDEAVTDTTATAEQGAIPAPTGGNTTADISADLDQIPDSSAALDADASASAQAVQGF